jgi:hypothetical protein
VPEKLLAVTNAGPHPPLLLAQFAAALARFLHAHAVLRIVAALSPAKVVKCRMMGGKRRGFPERREAIDPPASGPCPEAGSHPAANGLGMIVFFPTYARRLPGGRRWRATVAGMISRPLPPRSRRRSLAIGVLKRLLDADEEAVQSPLFQRRADAFLFQRVAGERVRISLGGRIIDVGLSDRVGHFERAIDLDEDEIDGIVESAAAGPRWIPYVSLPDRDDAVDHEGGRTGEPGPPARGRIHLVDAEGTSVISDIDDTVKVTNVADRRELLANTLLREFHAVPGIAEVYRRWQERGHVFHYVSSSPWQLAESLGCFLDEAALPAGSLHLKLFRLKDSTPLRRLPSRKGSKRRVIERILADFPDRRFLLVGDSGERDPEVYAAVARRHPERVPAVLIREVVGRASPAKLEARLARIIRRLPSGVFHTFADPADLPATIGT